MAPRVTNLECAMDAGVPMDLKLLVTKPDVQALIRRREARIMGGGRIEVTLSGSAKAILEDASERIVITGEADVKSARAAASRCCKKLASWGALLSSSEARKVRKSFRVVRATGKGELGFNIKVMDAASRMPEASVCPLNELLVLKASVPAPVKVKVAFNGKVTIEAENPCEIREAFKAVAPVLARFRL